MAEKNIKIIHLAIYALLAVMFIAILTSCGGSKKTARGERMVFKLY